MELVMEKIFIPLKMSNSYFEVPTEMTPRLAKGMAGRQRELDMETPKIEHAGRRYKVPNGGIHSTPNDLAKFGSS
jgi:CubicO group peptidase (beta-lactamase class C family)